MYNIVWKKKQQDKIIIEIGKNSIKKEKNINKIKKNIIILGNINELNLVVI